MEELIFVRRTLPKITRQIEKPFLKIQLKGNRFLVSKAMMDAIGADENDGLMFAFNKKGKVAYVSKENEEDSFRPKIRGNNFFRFTSKDLMAFFESTFSISRNDNNTVFFYIEESANERGLHKISLTPVNGLHINT
jgi:hypothetical protein